MHIPITPSASAYLHPGFIALAAPGAPSYIIYPFLELPPRWASLKATPPEEITCVRQSEYMNVRWHRLRHAHSYTFPRHPAVSGPPSSASAGSPRDAFGCSISNNPPPSSAAAVRAPHRYPSVQPSQRWNRLPGDSETPSPLLPTVRNIRSTQLLFWGTTPSVELAPPSLP